MNEEIITKIPIEYDDLLNGLKGGLSEEEADEIIETLQRRLDEANGVAEKEPIPLTIDEIESEDEEFIDEESMSVSVDEIEDEGSETQCPDYPNMSIGENHEEDPYDIGWRLG